MRRACASARGLLGCLLASALVALFPPAAREAGAAVTLRYGHAAGSTLRYSLSVDSPNAQGAMKVQLTLEQHVTAVDGAGVMDIVTSFAEGTTLIDGVSSPFPVSGQIMRTRMARNGQLVSTEALGAYRDLMAKAGFTSFLSNSTDVVRSLGILEFPTTAISPGATWSVTKSQAFPSGDDLSVTYSYTYESQSSYRGYSCALIKVSAQPRLSLYQDFPAMRAGMHLYGDVTVSGTLWFATTEGKIVKLEETIESNTVGTMITYEGAPTVIPKYQKTSVSLEVQ